MAASTRSAATLLKGGRPAKQHPYALVVGRGECASARCRCRGGSVAGRGGGSSGCGASRGGGGGGSAVCGGLAGGEVDAHRGHVVGGVAEVDVSALKVGGHEGHRARLRVRVGHALPVKHEGGNVVELPVVPDPVRAGRNANRACGGGGRHSVGPCRSEVDPADLRQVGHTVGLEVKVAEAAGEGKGVLELGKGRRRHQRSPLVAHVLVVGAAVGPTGAARRGVHVEDLGAAHLGGGQRVVHEEQLGARLVRERRASVSHPEKFGVRLGAVVGRHLHLGGASRVLRVGFGARDHSGSGSRLRRSGGASRPGRDGTHHVRSGMAPAQQRRAVPHVGHNRPPATVDDHDRGRGAAVHAHCGRALGASPRQEALRSA
mmetsp:Transcript_19645/g.75441  ORF Transcript_19645/g.75441 Transcript_19645/m.75441 type:complete len:374 (-) Transcript_19645:812-1933(-)